MAFPQLHEGTATEWHFLEEEEEAPSETSEVGSIEGLSIREEATSLLALLSSPGAQQQMQDQKEATAITALDNADNDDSSSDREESAALAALDAARSALGSLDPRGCAAARTAVNPYERLGRGPFVCRSALKLANLDAFTGFGLVGATPAAPAGDADDAAVVTSKPEVCRGAADRSGDGGQFAATATDDDGQQLEEVGKGSNGDNDGGGGGGAEVAAERRQQPENVFGFVDVCASPGGFSEYIIWRCLSSASGSGGLPAVEPRGVAMSLVGDNADGVGPDWSQPSSNGGNGGHGGSACNGSNDCSSNDNVNGSGVVFVAGPTGTGDVYERCNREALVRESFRQCGGRGGGGGQRHRRRRPSLVVADGGFSANRNRPDQDRSLSRLALCEFAIGVDALDIGGNLVVKLFLPLRAQATVALVHLAARLFERVGVFKPVASRASSGEAYLVARNFREVEGRTRGAVVGALGDAADALAENDDGVVGVGAAGPGVVDGDGLSSSYERRRRCPSLGPESEAALAATVAYLARVRRGLVALQTSACEDIYRAAVGLPVAEPVTRCRVAAYEAIWRLPPGCLRGGGGGGGKDRRRKNGAKRSRKEEQRSIIEELMSPPSRGKRPKDSR